MTNDKRIVLFIVLLVGWMLASSYLTRLLGLNPEPPKRPLLPPNAAALKGKDAKVGRGPAGEEPAQEKAKVKAADAIAAKAPGNEPAAQAEAIKKPDVAVVNESELVLGSVADTTPGGFRLEVQLQQKGGGVDSVSSSRFDAEFEDGRPRKRPLQLMRRDPAWPPSLAVTFSHGDAALKPVAAEPEAQAEEAIAQAKAAEAEDWSDSVLWEVVWDGKGRIVRPIARGGAAADPAAADGQEVVFRARSPLGVVVTKTFRLWKNTDGFEVDLKFESPDKERSVVYHLFGPHGIKIEGEWYTGTFRDVVFGQVGGDLATYSAHDVASAKDKPVENTTLPLRFAGVENQYFATLIGPYPVPNPKDPRDRWDSKTVALVLHKDDKALQKADVGIRISSKPMLLAPGKPVSHTYRVFAGPKIADALAAYGPDYHAEGLASYHKSQWLGIPFAPLIARSVITPTLAFTYRLTTWVSRLFGGSKGNYGIAIILLTVIVRGLMFPLGRKQARVAQKMQELQPQLKEIQEKFKDDKEKQTKETFALYKRHGNPQYSGCLPALIQLPIFVGLWQALNTSVALRHASFLWIRDLAAPDMLFRFPVELPLLGYFLGNWFNVLPFAVVGLMLVQTKLFSPPATTPEAEMQQKMMKYMMVFMGMMFYKVPSGLGIYFITSSLWAIGERLLLPKVTHSHPAAEPATGEKAAASRGGGPATAGQRTEKGGAGGNGAAEKPPGKIAQWIEKLMEEASKDATYRKMVEDRDSRDRDGKSARDKGKPRPRPGRR
ncbi:MAG: YidC/Oxa1 family insertase periplasmic-domain containing protein [Isosphaeraceae bacterium]